MVEAQLIRTHMLLLHWWWPIKHSIRVVHASSAAFICRIAILINDIDQVSHHVVFLPEWRQSVFQFDAASMIDFISTVVIPIALATVVVFPDLLSRAKIITATSHMRDHADLSWTIRNIRRSIESTTNAHWTLYLPSFIDRVDLHNGKAFVSILLCGLSSWITYLLFFHHPLIFLRCPWGVVFIHFSLRIEIIIKTL